MVSAISKNQLIPGKSRFLPDCQEDPNRGSIATVTRKPRKPCQQASSHEAHSRQRDRRQGRSLEIIMIGLYMGTYYGKQIRIVFAFLNKLLFFYWFKSVLNGNA